MNDSIVPDKSANQYCHPFPRIVYRRPNRSSSKSYCKKGMTAARAPNKLATPLIVFPLAALKAGVGVADADADMEGIDLENMAFDAVGMGMAIEDQAAMEDIEGIAAEPRPLH